MYPYLNYKDLLAKSMILYVQPVLSRPSTHARWLMGTKPNPYVNLYRNYRVVNKIDPGRSHIH